MDGKDQGHVSGSSRRIVMDMMLANVRVEAAEDPPPPWTMVHDSAHLFVSRVIPFKFKILLITDVAV